MADTNNPAVGAITRLFKPPVADDYIDRKRLFERMARPERRVCVVVAPAGYGKTSLVSRWIDVANLQATWMSLDIEDDDPRRFLGALADLWQSTFPSAADILRQQAGAQELPAADVIVRDVVSRFKPNISNNALVLDDLHRVCNTAVLDIVYSLITHLAPFMRIAVISRTSPPLRLGRLRAAGVVTDVRQRHLTFRRKQTQTFVEQHIGASVDNDVVEHIHALTEGWPSGVRMILLAAEGRPDFEDFVKGISGSVWQIQEYLLDEVLGHFDGKIVDLLVRAALLEKFSPALIESVFDDADGADSSAKQLIMLVGERGLFVVPLDAAGEWYRFHHQFQSLLRDYAAKTLNRKQRQDVLGRAAAWYEAQESPKTAIDLYLRAEDFDAAAQVSVRHGVDALNRQDNETLAILLAALPADVVDQSFDLLILQAFSSMNGSRYAQMSRCVDRLKELCADSDSDSFSGRACQARYTALQCVMRFVDGDLAGIVEALEQRAWEIPRALSFERSEALMLLAASKQLIGDTRGARDYLYRALERSDQQSRHFRVRVLVGICYLFWYEGDLVELQEAAACLLQEGREASDDYAIIFATWFKAAAQYLRNDLAGASDTLGVIESKRYWPHEHSYCNSARILALVLMAQGNYQKAQQTLSSLTSHLIERNSTTWLPEVHTLQAELAVRQGETADVNLWVREFRHDTIITPHGFDMVGLRAAKVMLGIGSAEALRQAGTLIDEHEAYFSKINASRFSIEVSILRAVHSWKTGDLDRAVAAITEGIKAAKQGEFVRAFADFGPEIAPLLNRLRLDEAHTAFVGRILRAISVPNAVQESGIAKNGHGNHRSNEAGLVDPLSRREIEVLGLLAEHLTNKEIADQLFISAATVKRHAHNIYEKLDVSNRRAARAKAVGLGII